MRENGVSDPGDYELLSRCTLLLRLAEQLDRGEDQAVCHAGFTVRGRSLELDLVGEAGLARWGLDRRIGADAFTRAFGRRSRSNPRGTMPSAGGSCQKMEPATATSTSTPPCRGMLPPLVVEARRGPQRPLLPPTGDAFTPLAPPLLRSREAVGKFGDDRLSCVARSSVRRGGAGARRRAGAYLPSRGRRRSGGGGA
jgi:hypothetical protein